MKDLQKKYYPFLILLCLLASQRTIAQLSPGLLTSSHSELEGMSNCTKCHDIGKKVPDTKCLSCHDEIQDLVSNERGYHASQEVSNMQCIDCHSEHHGRKFEMIRFDTETFDHKLTSYELEGKHAQIDCRQCHKPDNILDADLKNRTDTWLGLEGECLTCHSDYHQETLGPDCASCHDFEAFRPAPGFDHNDTQYALEGKHRNVECLECHPIKTRNGHEFQVFAGLTFNDCINCHTDPHNSLPGNCNSCHTVEGFDIFKGQQVFDHSITSFNLSGAHRSVSCFDCHKSGLEVSSVFQDQTGIAEDNCVSCHEDIHEGKFGVDCAQCHNVNSFLELNAGMEFDHSLTDYPLEGMHQTIECSQCHIESFTQPIDFSYCRNCHDDYHEGQFVEDSGLIEDCSSCHSVAEPFSFTSYGLREHADSDFPLVGAHVATPCFACHLDESSDEWQFSNLGRLCVDCHEDIHKAFISESYYPGQDCRVCHNSQSWHLVKFDHDTTDWPLENKHTVTDCRDCHFQEKNGIYIQSFSNLSKECYACHENVHGPQFEEAGVTDCKRCHSTKSWGPEDFDHSKTQFPLEGKHSNLECQACHTKRVDNKTVFKIERFECIDCHS